MTRILATGALVGAAITLLAWLLLIWTGEPRFGWSIIPTGLTSATLAIIIWVAHDRRVMAEARAERAADWV